MSVGAPPSPAETTAFIEEVIRLVKSIPRGRVATYGQIAALAGRPWASRGVSMILHARGRLDASPWQRVVRTGGHVKFRRGTPEFTRQVARLRDDGVPASSGAVDLKTYGWKRRPPPPTRPGPRPTMFG